MSCSHQYAGALPLPGAARPRPKAATRSMQMMKTLAVWGIGPFGAGTVKGMVSRWMFSHLHQQMDMAVMRQNA